MRIKGNEDFKMKKLKKVVTTAVSLTLCLGLSACSGDNSAETETGNDNTISTESNNNSDDVQDIKDIIDNQDTDNSDYLEELAIFMNNFVGIQEVANTAAANYSIDPTNPEYIKGMTDWLDDMKDKLSGISTIEAPEEFTEVHNKFANSSEDLIVAINSMIEMYNIDLTTADLEVVLKATEINENYNKVYFEFYESLVNLQTEMQQKMFD